MFDLEDPSIPSPEAPAVAAATETKLYVDGTTVTGPGPLPEHSPAEQDAQDQTEAQTLAESLAKAPEHGPNAQDAALFVQTNPVEALEVHGILTQALRDAGHVVSLIKTSVAGEGGALASWLEELTGYVHSHPTTEANINARVLLAKIKALL